MKAMNCLQKTMSILTVLLIPLSTLAQVEQADDLEFLREALKNPKIHEIVIPEGSYVANRPIIVDRSDVSIVGKGQVTITLADHANSPLLILGNIETPAKPVSRLKVSNLILKGNRIHQDMECWGGPCDSTELSKIRNNGITLRGVHDVEINNVQTLSMRSGGVVTEKVCTELKINGLVSKDNYFDGFAGYETTRSIFKNLDLSENLGAGISLDIHFHKNKFQNVLMNKNMDVGIFMRDSNGNKFANVKISDSGSHAVFISQVDELAGTVPKNNTFEKLFVDGGKGNGFHLNNAGNNRLVNPKFNNVRGQDIFVPAPGILQILNTRLKCKYLF